jgi:adenylylsulfate reductase subunit B
MPPVIDEKKCKRCGRCVEVCQCDVFFGSKRGELPKITYSDECWHCNACVEVCGVKGAIKLRIPLPMMVIYKKRERRRKK